MDLDYLRALFIQTSSDEEINLAKSFGNKAAYKEAISEEYIGDTELKNDKAFSINLNFNNIDVHFCDIDKNDDVHLSNELNGMLTISANISNNISDEILNVEEDNKKIALSTDIIEVRNGNAKILNLDKSKIWKFNAPVDKYSSYIIEQDGNSIQHTFGIGYLDLSSNDPIADRSTFLQRAYNVKTNTTRYFNTKYDDVRIENEDAINGIVLFADSLSCTFLPKFKTTDFEDVSLSNVIFLKNVTLNGRLFEVLNGGMGVSYPFECLGQQDLLFVQQAHNLWKTDSNISVKIHHNVDIRDKFSDISFSFVNNTNIPLLTINCPSRFSMYVNNVYKNRCSYRLSANNIFFKKLGKDYNKILTDLNIFSLSNNMSKYNVLTSETDSIYDTFFNIKDNDVVDSISNLINEIEK